MTSRNLAQSQQEANEPGESSNPSSPASTNAKDLSDGSMVAAGGFSRPLAASLPEVNPNQRSKSG